MNVDREGRLDLTVIKYVSGSNPLRVKCGDVLFNNTNSAELIGKTAYIGIEADLAFSNHMTRLRPLEGIDARFMSYQLHFLWMMGYFQHRCTHHVNQASVSSTALAESVPFVVAPTSEQSRIAGEIEKQFTRLDAAVGALKRTQANLKRYHAAVLKAACEGHLTADWRVLNSNTRAAEEAWSVKKMPKTETVELPLLPDTWSWYRLKSISHRVSVGHVGPTSEFYCPAEVGVPFVRSQNVRPGKLDFEGMQYITPEFHRRLKKSTLLSGDLLVVRVGANRGDTCSVAEGLGDINCANVVSARPYQGLSLYLEAYCQSQLGQELLLGMTTGSAQGVLNTKSVAELPVPVPPADERVEILQRLENLETLTERIEKSVRDSTSRAGRLRQAILKRAFVGELVDHNPKDEPASTLLERIRVERLAEPRASRNKGRRAKEFQNVS